MVGSSAEKLAQMSLDGNGQYTDITGLLVSKTQNLKNGTVVKNPMFSLFEGTHALEVMNDKLDSGLISLSPAELEFDVVKGRSLKEVCWLCDSVFRSTFAWLNYSTLPQTLLSNRYVEELLVNYTADPEKGLESCVFAKEVVRESIEDQLVHSVLRNVILGCLFLVKIGCTFVQSGVVYEEEDINSQAMNLNILSTLQIDVAMEQLVITWSYLDKKFNDEKDALIIKDMIEILQGLLRLPLLVHFTVPPKTANVQYDSSFLDEILVNINHLSDNLEYLQSLEKIPGCYSRGIQKRLDNQAPPRALVSYENEDFSSLKHLIQDLKQIFTISERETSQDIISHALNFSHTKHHPLARAFNSLLLIRDDRSILGVQTLESFLEERLKAFSCFGSQLFSSENHLVRKKVDEITQQLSDQLFEILTVLNQNPSRQRQLLSRLIIQFDSLQAAVEDLEVNLSSVFQIKDEFKENENQEELTLAVPLTSWVYYVKLEIMISVVLKGFELNLYKPWEFHSMYSYVVYLVETLLSLLDRVKTYNLYKIQSIKGMKAKLKKKKADQRQRFKEKYEQRCKEEIPVLEGIMKNLKEKAVYYGIVKNLSALQVLHLTTLIGTRIIQTPKFPFGQDLEMLYNLRMKPFSTVGMPQMITYDSYNKGLNRSLRMMAADSQVQELRTAVLRDCNQLIGEIESSESSEYRINKDSWVNWFKELQKSSILICLNLHKGQSPQESKVVIETDGVHRYFPVVKVIKK